MDNINITLDTLYDILRNEKKREELQQLDERFFVDVVTYLREKRGFINAKKEEEELFGKDDHEKLEIELKSIKRILKEIYERREKKIFEIALNRSRTGSDIIDSSSMLREEKEMYKRILHVLDGFRKSILLRMFKADLPGLPEEDVPNFDEQSLSVENPSLNFESSYEEPAVAIEDEEEESNMVMVRITGPIPSFMWKDMKEYGPYDEGDVIEIFPEVAELMIKKGRAVKLD